MPQKLMTAATIKEKPIVATDLVDTLFIFPPRYSHFNSLTFRQKDAASVRRVVGRLAYP
jgi:hypothetical protein